MGILGEVEDLIFVDDPHLHRKYLYSYVASIHSKAEI
jgi:hypothetical protein